MPSIKSPLSDEARATTAQALQGALVDLIDLSLTAKQAHWNLVGKRFRSVHLQLDEVVVAARQFTDQVAERSSTIGVSPDGRAETVASATPLQPIPPDWLSDDKVIAYFVDALATIIDRFRERIATTEESDPVSQDLLIAVTDALEKHYWMFQAEQ
jgi:starvation-inducible DNA-binding protein